MRGFSWTMAALAALGLAPGTTSAQTIRRVEFSAETSLTPPCCGLSACLPPGTMLEGYFNYDTSVPNVSQTPSVASHPQTGSDLGFFIREAGSCSALSLGSPPLSAADRTSFVNVVNISNGVAVFHSTFEWTKGEKVRRLTIGFSLTSNGGPNLYSLGIGELQTASMYLESGDLCLTFDDENPGFVCVEEAPLIVKYSFASVPQQVSLSAGGQQELFLDAGSDHAFKFYAIVGSMSGALPGIPLPLCPFDLPVVSDAYFDFTLTNSSASFYTSFVGVLDADGRAVAAIQVPSGTGPSLAGQTLTHAYVVASGPSVFDFASGPAYLTLVP